MTRFHMGECSRQMELHKKITSDQASVCVQREDRMEVSEDECSWQVGLLILRS